MRSRLASFVGQSRCVLHRTCGVVAAVSVPVLSLCVCALWHLFYSTLNAFKCVKYATEQILRSINTTTQFHIWRKTLFVCVRVVCVFIVAVEVDRDRGSRVLGFEYTNGFRFVSCCVYYRVIVFEYGHSGMLYILYTTSGFCVRIH